MTTFKSEPSVAAPGADLSTEDGPKGLADLLRRQRGVLLLGIALAAAGFGRVGANVLVNTRAGAEALGQFNLLLSLGLLGSLLTASAVQPTAIKFLAEWRGRAVADLGRLQSSLLLAAVALSGTAAVVLLALHLSGLYDLTPAGGPGPVLAVLFAASFYYTLRGLLLGLGRQGRYSLLESVGNVALLVGLALVPTGAFGWMLASYFAIVGVAGIASLATGLQGPLPWTAMRPLVRYGAITLTGTAASLGIIHLGNLVLGYVHGKEALGFYSAALTLVLVLYFVPQVMGLALLPRFSFLFGQGDMPAARRLLVQTTWQAGAVGLALAAPVALAAPLLLRMLFGGEHALQAATALRVLTIHVFLLTASRPAVAYLSGTRHVSVPNTMGVVALLINAVLWPWLVPAYGVTGTAVAAIAGLGTNAVVCLIIGLKKSSPRSSY